MYTMCTNSLWHTLRTQKTGATGTIGVHFYNCVIPRYLTNFSIIWSIFSIIVVPAFDGTLFEILDKMRTRNLNKFNCLTRKMLQQLLILYRRQWLYGFWCMYSYCFRTQHCSHSDVGTLQVRHIITYVFRKCIVFDLIWIFLACNQRNHIVYSKTTEVTVVK